MTAPYYTVIYEDESLIVVDKSPGVLSVPATFPSEAPDLRTLISLNTGKTLYPVNRIDKNASGIVMFAFDKEAHRELCGCFARRLVHKEYLAIVRGIPSDNEFTITASLLKKSNKTLVRPHGKKCSIHVKVIKRYIDHALLKIETTRGYRHQIRVLLAFKGHPVAGDSIYGKASQKEEILYLHCGLIKIPYKGEEVTFQAPTPPHFIKLIHHLNNKIKDLNAFVKPKSIHSP